jgi:PilZ domain
MLRMLGFGPKPMANQLKLKLPQLNSFVDLTMTGGGPRGSVCVEALNERSVIVGALPGTKPGGTGVFSYSNVVGRFRFSAKCTELRGGNALFAIPERIETLQVFSGAQQRTAVRIDATVPAQWRFAPNSKGTGDYVRGSLTDISRSGASLIVDREVKKGTFVEARFNVSTAAAPLVLLGEVMRSSAIESSKRLSLGLRFHGVKPEEDRAIMEFINKRQAERRNRGLA